MVFNRLSVKVLICNLCYRCSQTNPPVVSQMAADSSKLLLWELHACCKKCLINRLEFNVEMAVLPCEFTWSPDGILFTVDATGSVFTVSTYIHVSQCLFLQFTTFTDLSSPPSHQWLVLVPVSYMQWVWRFKLAFKSLAVNIATGRLSFWWFIMTHHSGTFRNQQIKMCILVVESHWCLSRVMLNMPFRFFFFFFWFINLKSILSHPSFHI